MTRALWVSLTVLISLLCLGTTKTVVALNQAESTALIDFFIANNQALSNLLVPWGSDTSTACGSNTTTPWTGIGCDSTKSHIQSLVLSSVPLGGSIPNSFGGLSYLTRVLLANAQLHGTIPASFSSLTSLNRLDLHGNYFRMCGYTPPAFASSLAQAQCDVTQQNVDSCVENCCGCVADWTSLCLSDVPACAPCTGVSPPELNATCANGRWVATGSYTGPLTINGSVVLFGDLTVPLGYGLIFYGMDSYLNVTGKATLREALTFFVLDSEIKALKPLGTLLRKSVPFMSTSNRLSTLGSNLIAYAHAKRACQRPSVYTVGDAYTYTISYRYYNGCNSWWIILVCVLPAFLGGLLGALPALL